MSQETKEYLITFPHNMCGGKKRIIIPGKPELSMTEGYVHTITDDDYFPCSIGLSFPCDHEYHIEAGPVRFSSCALEDSVHGHILVGCDDGIAKLPHLIYSKADVSQAFRDVKKYNLFDIYLGNTEEWMKVLEHIYAHDPAIQALPETSKNKPESFNLDKLGWWM